MSVDVKHPRERQICLVQVIILREIVTKIIRNNSKCKKSIVGVHFARF